MSKKLLNQFSIEKLKNSQSLDDLGLIIVVAGFKTLPNGDESPNLVTLFEPYFLFCEICLFDHTWVITMFNLHQYNTIICQFYKKLLHSILVKTDTE